MWNWSHKMKTSALLTLALFSLFIGLESLPAITIVNYSATVNNRFVSGFNTENAVQNTDSSFVGAGYDWSGVGWNTSPGTGSFSLPTYGRVQNLVLLSPTAVFSAKHYALNSAMSWDSVRSQIAFVNTVGEAVHATLSGTTYSTGGDVLISKLLQPVSASSQVSILRVLDISSGNYNGQPLLMVGSVNYTNSTQITAFADGQLVATSTIQSINNASTMLTPSASTGTFKQYQTGDSGSPVLITYKGQLTIASEVTSAGGSGSSILPTSTYASATTAVLAKDGYALKFTIYDVPADTANTANRWNGGAGDGDFNNIVNWSLGVISGGKPVVFDSGAASGQTVINLGGDRSLRGVLFASSTASTGFTFAGGNTLTVGISGIRNEDANTQTFICNMILGDHQNWEAVGGDMVFSGNIVSSSTNSYLIATGGDRNITVSGAISGSTSVAREGRGTTYLNANNTYTGVTWIHEGAKISVNNSGGGSSTGSSKIFLENGGTLAGTGRIGGFVFHRAGGRIAPGVEGEGSVGTLTLAGEFNNIGGSILWDLNANSELGAGTNFDQIVITGNGLLSYESGVDLELSFGAGVNFNDLFWESSHRWTILKNIGGNMVVGSSAWEDWSYSNAKGTFTVSSSDGSNSSLVLTYVASTSLTSIPEPSVSSLLVGVLCALIVKSMRSRERNQPEVLI